MFIDVQETSTEAAKPSVVPELDGKVSEKGILETAKTESVTAERLLPGDVTTDAVSIETSGELRESLADQEAPTERAQFEHKPAVSKIEVICCSL